MQQNTALIDDIMAALDAESSQNVELIVRNTQNGATKKMALASLEQIIYSYLTTAPVVTNLASVLGVVNYGRTVTDANFLIMKQGFHLVDFGNPSLVSNLPQGCDGWGVLFSVTGTAQTLQIASDHLNNIWIRTADSTNIQQWIKLI